VVRRFPFSAMGSNWSVIRSWAMSIPRPQSVVA
jgi:hypothetical protein